MTRARERGRFQRIVIAGDLDAEIAERLISTRRRERSPGVTVADADALGPLGVAARPRW